MGRVRHSRTGSFRPARSSHPTLRLLADLASPFFRRLGSGRQQCSTQYKSNSSPLPSSDDRRLGASSDFRRLSRPAAVQHRIEDLRILREALKLTTPPFRRRIRPAAVQPVRSRLRKRLQHSQPHPSFAVAALSFARAKRKFSSLGYNKRQIAALGVAKDLNDSVRFLAGTLCEILPLWAALLIGSLHNFIGYGWVWLIFSGRAPPLPLWAVSLN
ncbi:hypothetical protein IEQ34_008151 [Dendrobium chrysotoxum]|uniref:Nodulin-like domain-containing protein n=1 Tax=Dendrobium chrysotoxum TaxID=161865 RepID=A0AAV7H671_DENCH|nr:hypothetical protein IEQ34_008151 [Dendrobium chrysotoxum]